MIYVTLVLHLSTGYYYCVKQFLRCLSIHIFKNAIHGYVNMYNRCMIDFNTLDLFVIKLMHM